MKIAIALFTTIVSSLVIFALYILLFTTDWPHEIKSGNIAGMIMGVTVALIISAIIFTMLYTWVRIFRPFNLLSRIAKTGILVLTVLISALIILTAAQVGFFARF